MNAKKVRTATLSVAAVLLVVYLNYGFTHPPKARGQRIMAVNVVHNISMSFELTNRVLATAPE